MKNKGKTHPRTPTSHLPFFSGSASVLLSQCLHPPSLPQSSAEGWGGSFCQLLTAPLPIPSSSCFLSF